MLYLLTLFALLVQNHVVLCQLVPRQWSQMPLCGQQCVQAAPLGTCSDTDWNCLCRTNAFMLSCVACISDHCSRTKLVDPSLRALEGQCEANGVDVALTPRPPDPPRTQTGTWTIPIPQSLTSTPSPDISTSPSPSPTSQSPPVSQFLTSAVTSTPTSTNRAATPSATPIPTTIPTSTATVPGSITTSSTTPSGSNVIGPDLTIGSTGQETSKSASSVPIIAGVVSGAGVLLISVVIFFLLYTRRLKRNQHKAPSSVFRQSTSASTTSPPSQTQWGQPLLGRDRRSSMNSSQHTTSPAMESVAFASSTSKGRSGPSRDPVIPHSDNSSSSDIYVRHEDSGLVLTPDGRAVVELPPDYQSLRNPNN